MAQSEFTKRLRDLRDGRRSNESKRGSQSMKLDERRDMVAIHSLDEASMKNEPDEQPALQLPLDRPISLSAVPHCPPPDMGGLIIDPNSPQASSSRKRPPGSDIQMTDVPLRTDSPFKSPRQSSNLRSSPEGHGKHQAARCAPRHFASTHTSQAHARNISSPHSGHYHEHVDQGKRAHPMHSTLAPAALWTKARPRGPHVSANDNIKILNNLFSEQQLSSNSFSLSSRPIDDSASDHSENLTPNTRIVKQPDSRPISQQQLAAEVKGIYSGLVMVENKCVHVVNSQTQALQQAEAGDEQAKYSLRIDHFQALIALHRTLLHEHHDFFHASQHPSAGPAIKDLALRYSMPARMWKHGIHNFLELLRHRLPESLDYMLAFIYLAYQMMALLYETVSSFEDTWLECLGDLGRYRMAIEEEDLRDREVWTGVARFWYMKAVDKNPKIGRLYHHLAILARSHPPFISSRESILTLFEPTISRARNPGSRSVSVDTWFVVTHACLFRVPNTSSLLTKAMNNFLGQVETQIQKLGARWREYGAYMATCNIAALLKYGCTDSYIRTLLETDEKSSSRPSAPEPKRDSDCPDPDNLMELEPDTGKMADEWRLTLDTFHLVLKRIGDSNVLPLIHVMLVFFWRLSLQPEGLAYLHHVLSFDLLSAYLNGLEELTESNPQLSYLQFPTPPQGEEQPLPEDFLLRGQVYADGIFPLSWFENASTDLDERSIEQPFMTKQRALRVKWLGIQLAKAVLEIPKDNDDPSKIPNDDYGSSKISNDDDGPSPDKEQRRWLQWDPRTDRFSAVSGNKLSIASMYANSRQAQLSPSDWNPERSAEADHGGHGNANLPGVQTPP